MKRNASFFLVLLLLALVPLRAFASVTGGLCASYAATAAAEHPAHDHGVPGAKTSQPDDTANPAASICSLCTACCTGVTFVAQAPAALAFSEAYGEPIPFLERLSASPYPDDLDRPPLHS